jgi:hypothetical protein
VLLSERNEVAAGDAAAVPALGSEHSGSSPVSLLLVVLAAMASQIAL